jgi:hypothetical protein
MGALNKSHRLCPVCEGRKLKLPGKPRDTLVHGIDRGKPKLGFHIGVRFFFFTANIMQERGKPKALIAHGGT